MQRLKLKVAKKFLQLEKIWLHLHSQSPDGEMVDALVSGASAERRVGSSPILGTSKGVSNKFFRHSQFCQKLYNKRDFKACEARKSGVYSA